MTLGRLWYGDHNVTLIWFTSIVYTYSNDHKKNRFGYVVIITYLYWRHIYVHILIKVYLNLLNFYVTVIIHVNQTFNHYRCTQIRDMNVISSLLIKISNLKLMYSKSMCTRVGIYSFWLCLRNRIHMEKI